MKSFKQLIEEVGVWSRGLFGISSVSKWHGGAVFHQNSLTGINEELGELYEALEAAQPSDIADALADMLVFLADYCFRNSVQGGYLPSVDFDTMLRGSVTRRWPGPDSYHYTAKLVMAVGRLNQLEICSNQGRKGFDKPEYRETELKKRVTNVFKEICYVSETFGFDAQTIVNNTWDKVVSKRNLQNWEQNKHDELTVKAADAQPGKPISVDKVLHDIVQAKVKEVLKPKPTDVLEQAGAEQALRDEMARNPTPNDVKLALQMGWTIVKTNGVYPNFLINREDASVGWACEFRNIAYEGQIVTVPHWLPRRLRELINEKSQTGAGWAEPPAVTEDVKIGTADPEVNDIVSFGDGLRGRPGLDQSYNAYCQKCRHTRIHRTNTRGICPQCVADLRAAGKWEFKEGEIIA